MTGASCRSEGVRGPQGVRARRLRAERKPCCAPVVGWARSLPPGASIRSDMWTPDEVWAAYVDPSHRLCSQLPLLDPDHPHVIPGRRGDSIAATNPTGKPTDAVGPVLRCNSDYRLSRVKLAVLGPDTYTPRRFDGIYTGVGFDPR